MSDTSTNAASEWDGTGIPMIGAGMDTAYEQGRESERDEVIVELKRMLGVCEYAEVRAFIPLLIDHLERGEHRHG